MNDPHFNASMYKPPGIDTPMTAHTVIKTVKKPKEPKATNKANKPNRKSSGDESSHVTSTSNVVLAEKIEKEENPTTSLIRRRPPLVTRLTTLEQNHFYQRKATPQIIPRGKSAWDYVLEEAAWMAIDFRQELRWKVGFAKGVSEACYEKIERTRFEKTFLPQEPSSEITDTLKAIANSLSIAVVEKFAEFEKQIDVSLNSPLESKETPSTPKRPIKQEQSSTVQPSGADFEALIEKGLTIPSLTLDPNHQVPFPPTTPYIQQNQIDYNYLLKHQQIICKDISRLSKLGFGTVIYGASYSGKTVALIYTMLSWIQATTSSDTEPANQTILIFGLQKCLLRWLFMLQSIVGHCCRFVLCQQEEWTELPYSSRLKNALSENQVKLSAIPQIVLVDGEDFESFFSLHFNTKIQNLQGVIVDVRGYPTKVSQTSIGPQNSAADALLTASPVLTGVSTSGGNNSLTTERKNKILLHLADTLPSTQTNRITVTDENFRLIDRFSTLSFLLPGAKLTDLIRKFQPSSLLNDLLPGGSMLPSPMKVSDSQSPSIQLPQDPHLKNTLNQLLINLSVHATIPSDLNTRAYAQIREEVISTELTFTQQKKYDEIAQVLMKSGYYDGSDMDKFARITTLLKMICFHSQLVSIKRVPNTALSNGNLDAPQYSFLSYRPSSSASAASSTNFVSNTASSSSSASSSVVPSANSGHGTYAQGYATSVTHSYIGGVTGAGNTASGMSHYQYSHGNVNGNGNSASNMNNSATKITATNHSVYFSPGPLIYKLHHNPSSFLHHHLPESYLHDGSNKLKILKTILHRFEGLRVVLVGGNWLELHLIHNYLQQHNINHLFPHYYLKNGQHHVASSSSMAATFPPTSSVANNPDELNNVNSPSFPEAFNEYFHHQDRFYWLGEENNIQLFNDSSVLSSILLTSLSAFKSPSMSPWLADAVILLSHEWDQYCEIKNCFRLRLLKAGPRGDPVTIIRVSSKNTIEEVMLRQKTGLPQLQGMKLIDLNLIQKNNNINNHHSHHGNSNMTGVSAAHDTSNIGSSNITNEIDYSSGFITNITFLKSIPLMHVPNKNFNSALPGSSVVGAGGVPNVYHHSTPVSPLGLSHSHSASFDIRASPTMGEVESQNNSGSEGNNTIGGAIPPRRGSGKGLILVNPPGKMPFLKDGNAPVITSASSNTNTSIAGWSNRSNLMTGFQDDTLIPYSSIAPSHLPGATSSRLATPIVKIDKQAVQKWLDTYRQALYYNYIEFIQPLSSSLQSNQSNNEEPHYLTTPSSQAMTLFEQRIQLILKQYPYFMTLEKQIIHKIYLFFFQRYLRLSSPSIPSSVSSSTSPLPNESSPTILPDMVDATSIYLERDYSHEISWFLSLFRSAAVSMEEKRQQSDRDGLTRLMSNIERLRLTFAGYGKPEKESKLLKLLLPLPPVPHHHHHHVNPQPSAVGAAVQSETMSVVSSTINAAETTTINGSIIPPTLSSVVAGTTGPSQPNHHHHHHHRPSVYQHFHDSLQEAMRLGLAIEPWLYNNPLQGASRYDDVTIPSYEHDLFNPDYSIKIKFMHANYNSSYNNTTTANPNGSAVNGGGVGGTASTTTKAGGNGRRKNSAGNSNAVNSNNLNAPGFTNAMNNPGMPMEYSDLQSSLSYSGNIDNSMGKRDLIGVIGNSSNPNLNNPGANRTYYSAPNEAGIKRGYEAMGGPGSGYYGASSSMPSIKDEGDHFNQEKRRKIEYNGGMYGYDRGLPNNNPQGSLPPDSYQSSYLPNYSSSMHHHPPPHTTTIGGMILPASSVQSYGGPSTGSGNPPNTSYSFDLNQQKLLLSESNLTAVTPNANMFSNNMMYDGSNNMISHDPNNPNNHVNHGGHINRSMSYGGNNTNHNPSYYNTNPKISVGGYPITDEQNTTGGMNNNYNNPNSSAGGNKYSQVKLPSIPSKSSSSNSLGSGYIQPLHPAMTIAGNPIPAPSVGRSQDELKRQHSISGSSYNQSSSTGTTPSDATALANAMAHHQSHQSSTEDEKWMAVEDDILICMQNAIHDPNFSHTMHWLNNAKGIVLKTSRTVQQAKNRYSYLCTSGKKDERMLDPNVTRAIAKLKKSIKRPVIGDGSDPNTSSSVAVSGDAPETAQAANTPTTPSTIAPTPTIGMTHAIEKKP